MQKRQLRGFGTHVTTFKEMILSIAATEAEKRKALHFISIRLGLIEKQGLFFLD